MSNYQDAWKSYAVSDLRNSTGFKAFVDKIRSFYHSSQSLVDAENEIIDLILEGYGTAEIFGNECIILEAITEYRQVLEERKTHRMNYHKIGQKAKSDRHLYLAKINAKYMKLARHLFKRVQKALFTVSLYEMTIEEEETCCICLISRNILPMCELPNMHLCCKVFYVHTVFKEASRHFDDRGDLDGFTELCLKCQVPVSSTIISERERNGIFAAVMNASTNQNVRDNENIFNQIIQEEVEETEALAKMRKKREHWLLTKRFQRNVK